MIPTPAQLGDIPRLPRGSLEEVPFAVLLHALALAERSVVVEVRRRQLEKTIIMELGVPVECRSNLVHETLGRYMVAQGKLSDGHFTACLSASFSRGVPLGEVLLENELIEPVELYRILQQNLAKKLLDLFSWRDGEFVLGDEVPEEHSSLKVKVPQLIVTGITRFAPQDQVDGAVGTLVGKDLVLDPGSPVALADLRLSEPQARLAEALARGGRMDQLAEASELPFDHFNRFLYALAILGLVVPRERLAAAPRAAPPPPAALPRPVPEPPPAALPRDLDRLRNEITQTYLAYRRLDPFDLLGVAEDASPAAVQARYFEFARRHVPWQFEGTDLAEKARDLFLAGARAYAELADGERRAVLVHRRQLLREEQARKPKVGPAPIDTDLLDPEAQYRKGQALLAAGKLAEAVQHLEFASDCDPQNGLYRAELAFVRFRQSGGSGGRQALEELKETLRIDPGCGLALYYAGLVHAELDHFAEAEGCLRRAIKLMAPDRRPIEALKELSQRQR